MEELTPKMIETIRDAARKLTGSKRRAFEARVSLDYFGGDTRLTETVFGWSRHTIVFGTSRETSDFIVDSLELWWEERKGSHENIRELVINLDNGPELASNRTQFIKRITEFADRFRLEIHLVYYPPYHSKYNPVERMWGILENHWNGTLLTCRETAIEWAKTMTWKGISPLVKILDKVFETGAKVAKKAFQTFQARLIRNPLLPKWDVFIKPGCQDEKASGWQQ